MRSYLFYLLVLLVAFAQFTGCSKDQALEPSDEPIAGGVTVENVSYTNFTSDLIQTKCASCHAQGGQGSPYWTFSDYRSVTNNATAINNAVLVTGRMPLTGSLSVEEKRLLQAWFDRGMPQE